MGVAVGAPGCPVFANHDVAVLQAWGEAGLTSGSRWMDSDSADLAAGMSVVRVAERVGRRSDGRSANTCARRMRPDGPVGFPSRLPATAHCLEGQGLEEVEVVNRLIGQRVAGRRLSCRTAIADNLWATDMRRSRAKWARSHRDG